MWRRGIIGIVACVTITGVQIKAARQDTVTLLFAGDAMSHTVQVKWARQGNTLDYSACFSGIKPYLERADLSIVNLEAPLAGAPYTGYPRFSAPNDYAEALRDAGFNLMLLANNHIADKGKAGLEKTIDELEQLELPYTGAYRNSEARSCLYPYRKTFSNGYDSMQVTFYNCTYGTNGMPVYAPNEVNRIDTAQIRDDLREAGNDADNDADIRVMCIHWGNEYQTRSSAAQRETARWLAEAGFDLIIGSHPHVVQEVDTITTTDGRKVTVFYSLGNMLSNQRWRGSNGGILAMVKLATAEKRITEVGYVPVYVHKGVWQGVRQYHLIPTAEVIDTIANLPIPKADRDSLRVFHNDTQRRLGNMQMIR